tara:strand:+ start:11890 stop:12153 length:264 start_codon:yes stop_codon:yes gene_type:complete
MIALKIAAFTFVIIIVQLILMRETRRRESKELASLKRCHRNTLNELKSNLADATRVKLGKDTANYALVQEIYLLKRIIRKLERWEKC